MDADQLKKCTKCGEAKALELFHKKAQRKDGRQSHCASCCSALQKERFANNESYIAKSRQYTVDNKAKLKAYSAAYIVKNPQLYAKKQKLANQKYIKEMSDVYIKLILSRQIGVSRSAIPKELIEAKREQLKLHRLLKELSK